MHNTAQVFRNSPGTSRKKGEFVSSLHKFNPLPESLGVPCCADPQFPERDTDLRCTPPPPKCTFYGITNECGLLSLLLFIMPTYASTHMGPRTRPLSAGCFCTLLSSFRQQKQVCFIGILISGEGLTLTMSPARSTVTPPCVCAISLFFILASCHLPLMGTLTHSYISDHNTCRIAFKHTTLQRICMYANVYSGIALR